MMKENFRGFVEMSIDGGSSTGCSIPMSSRVRIVPPTDGQKRAGDRVVRLVVLGDPNAGKTRFLERVQNNTFKEGRRPTMAIDFMIFYAYLDADCSEVTKVMVMDVPGEDVRRGSVKLYTRNVTGAVLLFDSTNQRSFDSLGDWKRELDQGTASCARILVGSKKDLHDRLLLAAAATATNDTAVAAAADSIAGRVQPVPINMNSDVMQEKALTLGAGCGFKFVSALTGEGVLEALLTIAAAASEHPDAPHNCDPMTARRRAVDGGNSDATIALRADDRLPAKKTAASSTIACCAH